MPFARSFTIPTSVTTALHEVKTLDKTGPIYPQRKRTLIGLIKNFRLVFPNSNINLRVLRSQSKDYILTKLFVGEIESSDGKHAYKVAIQLHRKDTTVPFSINSICEVRCQCPAFRFNTANPDLRNKNLYGKPTNWNRVQNKVKNRRLVPSLCKHLFSYARYLIQYGEISK